MPDTVSGRIARDFTHVASRGEFDAFAEGLLTYQKACCGVYARYEHTYLPVAAFKYAKVACFDPEEAVRVFCSSGTTGQQRSRHYVRDLSLYDRAVCTQFVRVFGRGPFTIAAHLPGYAPASSLVYMAQKLIAEYGDEASGFFIDDRAFFDRAISHSFARGTRLLLLGAAFGLLQLAEQSVWTLPPGAIVVETGGMKIWRRSVTRRELHRALSKGFGVPRTQVWSEYGMCELLSQAYATGSTVYFPPPWMRVEVFAPGRLEQPLPDGKIGVLGVVDLANVYTVSAIMTEDLGVRHGDGFEVIGRLHGSALRGCNFLLEDV